jgi:Cu-Zn family superoxide dismutase
MSCLTPKRSIVAMAVAVTGVLWLAACNGMKSEQPASKEESQPTTEASQPAQEQAPMEGAKHAVADLMAKSGSHLTGEADFVEEDNGMIAFHVNVENVSPGLHAVHIHENGDCSAEDASSAGGHWNPTHEKHGRWGIKPFHLGDIGNIDVGQDGKGTLSMSTDLWSLADKGDRSVIGKSIVVHAGPDDFKSQPAGNAGARIGCGVIHLEDQT